MAQAQLIKEVMTPKPVTLQATETVRTAATKMREADIGDVVVMKDGAVCGIVTDRDITVRAVADGKDADKVKIGDICSRNLVAVSADDSVDDAVRIMREKALRRLPVVEAGKPVGIVSIGDLAMERDQGSALADISAAPGNR
jgi:CBS domain-containing protein